MAQVRKLKQGNTINNVPSKTYFSVGDKQYDFKKFQDLIWGNFDAWIDHNGYNGKVRSGIKKFINQALDQLSIGTAKFKSDMSLEMKDDDNMWDTRPGFNRKGLKIFHWFTDDKIDDNRGIPHLAMNYLKQVIQSPYMSKKEEFKSVPNLTDQVLQNVIKLDFDNNKATFNDPNSGFYTYQQYDRVKMFKDALEYYRDNTDFSVYDEKSQGNIKSNIENALSLINSTSDYNDSFFEKISDYGFHGLEKSLGKSQEQLQREYEIKAQNQAKVEGWKQQIAENEEKIKALQDELNGIQDDSYRQYSINDYNRFVKSKIQAGFDAYYNTVPSTWDIAKDWMDNRKINFWTPLQLSIPFTDVSPNIYNKQLQTIIRKYNLTPQEAHNYGKNLAKQLTRFLMGLSTNAFNTLLTKQQFNLNVNTVVSLANATKSMYELYPGFYVLPETYDETTKAVTVINANTNQFIAIPTFLVDNQFWGTITKNINDEHAKSGKQKYKYGIDDIKVRSLKEFFKTVSFGNGTSIFNSILNYSPQNLKSGGIIKALSGAEIKQRILNDDTGLYSENVKNLYRGSNSQENTYSGEADQIRTQTATEAEARAKKRQQVNDLKSAKVAQERQRKKDDFLDDQNTVITSWSDLANNLNTHDKFVIGTLLSDIVALGGSLSGGAFNPVTDVATLSSIVNTVGAIYTDDSLSTMEKIGWGALGIGTNIFGLVPELGAGANAFKLAKVAQKALPILSKVIRYGAMGTTGLNALGPLTKLANGENLTKGDWEKIAYFTESLIMGKIGGKGAREFKKYTKPVEAKTKYYINTKSGKKQVDQQTFEKINGVSIKTLKEKYGTPETALKDIHGNEISIESLSTKGTINKLKGNGNAHGKIENTKEGIRLKTLEEIHQEYGVPKLTINGQVTYQVPKSYLRVAERLNQKPLTVIEDAGAESLVAERIQQPTVSETTPKVIETAKAPAETPKTKTPVETKPITPKVETPKEEPKVKTPKETPKTETKPEVKAEEKVENLRKKVENADERLAKIDQDVKDFVKLLITERYKTNPKGNYDTKGIIELLEKVQNFKTLTKGKLPTKNVRPGFIYAVSQKGAYKKFESSKIYNTTSKKKRKIYHTQRDKFIKHYKDKGWTLFKFNKGGNIVKYQEGNKVKDYFDVFESGKPQSRSDKFLGWANKFVDSPYVWKLGDAFNSARFYREKRKNQKQEQVNYSTASTSIIPITPSDFSGTRSQVQKSIGVNNTSASKATSGNLNDYYNSLNTLFITNNTLQDQQLTTENTQRNTDRKEIDTKLTTLQEAQRTIADENRKKQTLYHNQQLNYDTEYAQNMAGLRGSFFEDLLEDAKSKKKAKLAFNTELAKIWVKNSGTFLPEIQDITDKSAALMTKYENKDSWNSKIASNDPEAIEDFKTYSGYQARLRNLNQLRQAYELSTIFNASQGFLDYGKLFEEQLKKINFNVQDATQSNRGGGTLSYEDRMNLKKQDARNKQQEYYYKMEMQEKKRTAEERKQRRKEFMEAQRLINKKSEILLKASLAIK